MQTRNLKLFFCLILYIFTLYSIFSATYISQINFLDDEFIEIYSDKNITPISISDQTLSSQNQTNTLTKIKSSSSKYYLIVGNKFSELNNISNLNYTIFSTKKTGPGKSGLKNNGENITIYFQNFSIFFISNKSYTFESNQTLHYNFSSNTYLISDKTLNLNKEPTLNQTYSSNSSNISNLIQTPLFQTENKTNLTSCNISFKINLLSDYITEDKILFDFSTNATNYSITYWIENYLQKHVKPKRITYNLFQKTYSPKPHTQILTIKAILSTQNCNISDAKQTIFYSEPDNLESDKTSKKSISSSTSSTSSSSKTSSKQTFNKKSSIEFERDKNYLKYKVYRGDTRKRAIYIYEDKTLLLNFQIEKYSSVSGKLKISPSSSKKYTILGLDLEKTINFYPPENNLTKKTPKNTNSNRKSYFQINNISYNFSNSTKIYFSINTSLKNFSSTCYILYKKTQISNKINITSSNISNIYLNLNLSKLNSKTFEDFVQIKLLCKYKKPHLKSYKYSSKVFYIQQNQNQFFLLKTNSSFFSTSFKTFPVNTQVLDFQNPLKIFNKTQFLQNQTKNSNLISSSEKIKTNSIYLILLSISILTILLIISR